MEDGEFCDDDTCPYFSWPQEVELQDTYEMTTPDIEVKYGITKREAATDESGGAPVMRV